jgi:hypothetical protein
MLAGIAFQLGVMIIFVFIGLDFCLRIWKNKPYGSRVNKLGATNSNNIEMGTRQFDNESRRTSETHLKETHLTGAGMSANGQNWTGMSRGWWLFMFAMLISSIAIIIRGKSSSPGKNELMDRYLPNRRISRRVGWRTHQTRSVFLILFAVESGKLTNRGPSKRSRWSYDGSSSPHSQRSSHGFPAPPKTSLERSPLSSHPTPVQSTNRIQ